MPSLGPILFALLVAAPAGPAASTEDPGAIYSEANRLKASGDAAGAARAYARAHALLRERDVADGNTLYSLFEAIDLFLAAHGKAVEPALLCEARALLDTYQSAIAQSGRTATAEVTDLERRLSVAQEKYAVVCVAPPLPEPPESPAEPPPGPRNSEPPAQKLEKPAVSPRPEGPSPAPPGPPPPKRRGPTKLEIGAYSGIGLAGLGIGLLAAGAGVGLAAERDGEFQANNGISAGELQDSVISRGRTANALAYAGVALATTGVITGVALLVAHRRRAGKRSGSATRGQFAPLL